jgi:glycosyltransferase involved in cell wall biosynthesis
VDGRSVPAVADAVAGLLADPRRARQMGEKGRSWVEREWRWEIQARRLDELLTKLAAEEPDAVKGIFRTPEESAPAGLCVDAL